jgi:hypothetical protein
MGGWCSESKNLLPSHSSRISRQYDQAVKILFENANAWIALYEILTNMLQDQGLKMN